jgi:hypothetical protein
LSGSLGCWNAARLAWASPICRRKSGLGLADGMTERGNVLTQRVPVDFTPHRFPIHSPDCQPNCFFRQAEFKPYLGKGKAVVPAGIAFRFAVGFPHFLVILLKS